MMFRHAETGGADFTGQPQQRKPLVRPRFKEGWVSESGSDFSSKSRLNPGLSGNVAECKVGGSVSDVLAPHGPPLTDNEDKVGKKGRRRGVGNDP